MSMLVVFDINMPRVNGIEVLSEIKRNPATAVFPVIMLTTTDDPREVQRCYELGCSVYLTKPVQYTQFVEAIKRLGMFLEIIKPPAIPAQARLSRASHMSDADETILIVEETRVSRRCNSAACSCGLQV